MTSATLLGAILVVIGSVALAAGTAVVSRANPTQRIPYAGNKGYEGYLGSYLFGLATGLAGSFQLRDEHGGWAVLAAAVVFFAPFSIIRLAHASRRRRILARQQPGRPASHLPSRGDEAQARPPSPYVAGPSSCDDQRAVVREVLGERHRGPSRDVGR